MKRYFLEVLIGFVLAVVLAVVPPIAFLAIPAAGFFLAVVPIWSVGVVGVLFFGLLIFGRIPAAIGVSLLAFAVALSPLGRATVALVDQVDKNANDNDFIQRKFRECATTGFTPLSKPSAKHDLIVLDVDTNSAENYNVADGAENYNVADTVAVLTGMRVVEIIRAASDRHVSEARETVAERSDSCVGERDSAVVGVLPGAHARSWREQHRPFPSLTVDACLRRTRIPDPSGDRTPAIVLRAVPFGLVDCHVTEVIERTQSGDVQLGRVHYESFHQRYYPDLALPEGVPKNNWLIVLLGEILQQDLSDKALTGHAVTTTK